jgi:hypothetical protein
MQEAMRNAGRTFSAQEYSYWTCSTSSRPGEPPQACLLGTYLGAFLLPLRELEVAYMQNDEEEQPRPRILGGPAR